MLMHIFLVFTVWQAIENKPVMNTAFFRCLWLCYYAELYDCCYSREERYWCKERSYVHLKSLDPVNRTLGERDLCRWNKADLAVRSLGYPVHPHSNVDVSQRRDTQTRREGVWRQRWKVQGHGPMPRKATPTIPRSLRGKGGPCRNPRENAALPMPWFQTLPFTPWEHKLYCF